MSKSAPTNGDSTPLLKFCEFELWADGPHTAKNGTEYYKLTFQMTPFIDPANPPASADEVKVKTWKTTTGKWSREYVEVYWPSCQAQVALGTIKDPDDLITWPGEMPRRWLISYQTPLFLIPARPDDLQWAKDNNRFDSLAQNEIGQWMKKTYPVKLVNIYGQKENAVAVAAYEADALKNAPAPPPPDPDRAAYLTALQTVFVPQWLVIKDGILTDVDMFAMEANLQTPPFNTYFSIHSPEIKTMVARAIIGKIGRDEEALKGICLNLNGFLDVESKEIKEALEEAAF